MAEAPTRIAMPTLGGTSVRKEIDRRLEAARTVARSNTIEECIAFLNASGFADAAGALQRAAFEPQQAVAGVGMPGVAQETVG